MFFSLKATDAVLSGKLFFIIVLLYCTCSCAHGAVPDDELQALMDIAVSLNKTTGWNYTADPCTDWGTAGSDDAVACNCTISGDNLCHVVSMYLTDNKFTGPMRDWFFTTRKYIDLSYNNFTINGSSCLGKSVNLFKSASESNNVGDNPCWDGMQCQENSSSLHINGGGPAVYVSDDGVQIHQHYQ